MLCFCIQTGRQKRWDTLYFVNENKMCCQGWQMNERANIDNHLFPWTSVSPRHHEGNKERLEGGWRNQVVFHHTSHWFMNHFIGLVVHEPSSSGIPWTASLHWFIGSLVHWFIDSVIHGFTGIHEPAYHLPLVDESIHWFVHSSTSGGSLTHWFRNGLWMFIVSWIWLKVTMSIHVTSFFNWFTGPSIHWFTGSWINPPLSHKSIHSITDWKTSGGSLVLWSMNQYE